PSWSTLFPYTTLFRSSKEGRTRLETMVRTSDGFEIAEVDLQLRGPGDISGTQQSGVLEMKIANLASDQAILMEARNSVIEIFKEDPSLSDEKNMLLAHYLNQRFTGISRDKNS